eukprot:scaffold4390_cov264-Pinguiococcus_pyrenoidosus.AAC.17
MPAPAPGPPRSGTGLARPRRPRPPRGRAAEASGRRGLHRPRRVSPVERFSASALTGAGLPFSPRCFLPWTAGYELARGGASEGVPAMEMTVDCAGAAEGHFCGFLAAAAPTTLWA